MAGLGGNYQNVLNNLKEKIRQARLQASLAVNKELLTVYWEIGNTILQQQKQEGWGTKVIQRLVRDLKTEFPDMKGLSQRNFVYMQTFAATYPYFPFTQPPVAKLQNKKKIKREKIAQPTAAQLQKTKNFVSIIVQPLLAQIPWTHHTIILDKTKTTEEKIFYIQKTIEHNWSKNILSLQIKSDLYQRQGKAITNFENTLPKPQSDLAQETLKNPYVFDFLGIGEEIQERELEKALIQHIKKFILELGRGFAYIGNQHNLRVEDDDFYPDLLFYNYHLHCFVVFELKVGDFMPEFAGKLNFYINTVDEQLKGKEDKPTIGVLLCKTSNETVIKYSLKSVTTPMGVADYELTNALPKKLKGEMPTIEELEQELEKEIILPQKPIDEKKKKLYDIISRIKGEEVKKERDNEAIIYLFNVILKDIKKRTEKLIADEMKLFKDGWIARSINGASHISYTTADIEARLQKETISELGLYLRLNGLKRAGTKAFDNSMELQFNLYRYKYNVGLSRDLSWQERLYHQPWTDEELQQVAEQWSEAIIDEINRLLESIV